MALFIQENIPPGQRFLTGLDLQEVAQGFVMRFPRLRTNPEPRQAQFHSFGFRTRSIIPSGQKLQRCQEPAPDSLRTRDRSGMDPAVVQTQRDRGLVHRGDVLH